MRNHRSWALVLALCLAPVPAFAKAGDAPKQATPGPAHAGAPKAAWITKTDEQTLISAEREAWEVFKKKDWKAFDRLLTPDFVWIDDGGIIAGRAATVKYFTGFDIADFTMQDVKVTAFGPGVAFVTYNVTLQGRFQGEPIPAKPSYIGSGYVKRGGRWVNFFAQSTLSR